MRTWKKIAIGVIAAGGLGYLAYKMFGPPPAITVYTFNQIDGTGTFQWGPASGQLMQGGYEAGWGYSGTFTNYTAGTGWSFQVTKNGKIYKTIVIPSAGVYNI